MIVTVKPPIKMTQRFEPISVHQSNAFILALRETTKEHPKFSKPKILTYTHTHLTGIIIDQTRSSENDHLIIKILLYSSSKYLKMYSIVIVFILLLFWQVMRHL